MSTPSQWEHFTIEELACPCCGEVKMDPAAMEQFVFWRKAFGASWPVVSGYRCPDYNEQISSTGRTGPHTTGKAMDIHISSSGKRFRLLRFFMAMGVRRMGLPGKSVHVDLLTASEGFPEEVWWTY